DLDVICSAPKPMRSWGYADLVAKVTAGADWMLADALGMEPIHAPAWRIVQSRLRELVSDPEGVRTGAPQAIALLVERLMLAGFALQSANNSRPAYAAHNQASHPSDV